MRLRPAVRIRNVAVAFVLSVASLHGAFATGAKPSTDPEVDPAPCVAAATANDADRIIAACGVLIDSARTLKPDRIKALVARGGAHERKDMIDNAISDYDAALWLDPGLADIFNIKGELWRKKGDRRRALADFASAIKLNPDHAAAKASYRSLAQELERLGVLIAVANKPSFNCATAKRPVEKAICASPELADLDREIDGVHALVMRDAAKVGPRAVRALQRKQDQFIARRNASFGKPGYDLRKAMKERLQEIVGVDGY
ncbi:hypothetical protein [Bradyrhizobium sp.]|uniref:hypothetical protein n=1 Tax=Bradyrhizobium sp. TaxID=376 RepID=UPI00351E7618